ATRPPTSSQRAPRWPPNAAGPDLVVAYDEPGLRTTASKQDRWPARRRQSANLRRHHSCPAVQGLLAGVDLDLVLHLLDPRDLAGDLDRLAPGHLRLHRAGQLDHVVLG